MDEASITSYIVETFDDVDAVVADGNTFFFYSPGGPDPSDHRFPFATLVTNDQYDQFSNLDRPSVFRLNVGVSRQTYERLFGASASGAESSDPATSTYEFAALDRVMPHPVYGQMFWVCVLNPSDATFQAVQPLLAEAYDRAVRRHTNRR